MTKEQLQNKKEHRFDVGDEVVFVEVLEAGNGGSYAARDYKGKIGKITEKLWSNEERKSGAYYRIDIEQKNNGGGVWEGEVELATNMKKQEYKKGDIIIARYNAPYSFTGAGTVCIVKNVGTKGMIFVKPYNPFEGKEIEIPNDKTPEDLEVDSKYFMPFFSEKPDSKVEKKWAKLGKLLLKAVDLIKKLLSLLLKKKITEKEKEDVQNTVKQFFQDVKEALGEEEKKSKGEGDAQEEKKPEEGKGEGSGSDMDGKPGEGGGGLGDGVDGGKYEISKGTSSKKEKGKDSDSGERDKESEEIAKMMKMVAMLQKTQSGTSQQSAGSSSGDTSEKEDAWKIYCGVCKRHHTKGTHD